MHPILFVKHMLHIFVTIMCLQLQCNVCPSFSPLPYPSWFLRCWYTVRSYEERLLLLVVHRAILHKEVMCDFVMCRSCHECVWAKFRRDSPFRCYPDPTIIAENKKHRPLAQPSLYTDRYQSHPISRKCPHPIMTVLGASNLFWLCLGTFSISYLD